MATNITIAKLNTLVTANAVQFTQEFQKAENVAKRTSAAIGKALSSIGVGLSAAGVIAFGKSVIDFGSQITDLAQMAGMGTQAFQTLAAKGAESGITMEMVANGTENLRSKLQDAAEGTQATRDELAKLGLTFAGLQSLAPERQWEAIAQKVAMASDKQEAFNVVSDLFGAKIGPKLKEVLGALAGEDGFAGLSRETANLRITDAQLKSLDDFGDKLTNLWTQVEVVSVQGVSKWGEWLNALAHAGPTGHTLNDSWHRISAAAGLNKDEVDADFRSFDGLKMRGPDGSVMNFGASKKIANDLGAEMAKAAKAYAEAHPWDSITDENAQTSKVKSMLDAFFGPLDEKSKATRDNRLAINFPEGPTDRLSRIGLLNDGSKTIADESKKQTDLLKGVIQELKTISNKTGAGAAVYQ